MRDFSLKPFGATDLRKLVHSSDSANCSPMLRRSTVGLAGWPSAVGRPETG